MSAELQETDLPATTTIDVKWFETLSSAVAAGHRQLLINPHARGGPEAFDEAIERLKREGELVDVWSFAPNHAAPFQGLAGLVAKFLPSLSKECEGLVSDKAAELAAVNLHVTREDLTFITMDALALPASERRLSRESEYTFRITNGLARLVVEGLEKTAAFVGQKLWIFVPDVTQIDRVSLLSLNQLLQFASQKIIVVYGGPSSLNELTRCGTQEVLTTEPASSAERRKFLKSFLSHQKPIPLDAMELKEGRPSPLAPLLLDVDRFSEDSLFEAIQVGQYDLALSVLEHPDFELEAEARARLLGLAHAYIGNFQFAQEIYHRAMSQAKDPVMKARFCVYTSLLSAKRLSEYDRTIALIDEGLAALKGHGEAAALLETGWLLNVRALVMFRTKRIEEAAAICREAIATIKPLQGSDALHLKINLISNMSILFEADGNLRKSLAVWERFEAFNTGPARALFAKIYHFRKAGLLFGLGQIDMAMDQYLASWHEAQSIHDTFHSVVIAQTLGKAEFQRRRFEAAAIWFERAETEAKRCADHAAADKSAAARAIALKMAERPRDDPSEVAISDCEEWLHRAPETKLGRPFYLYHIAA